VTSTFGRSSRRLAAAALACALLGSLGADAPTESGDALLARVQKRYEGVRDVRARFEQTSFVAALGREDRSRGSVAIARPGRMRWEYGEPEQTVLVVDAEAVRLYSAADKKLQIAPLGAGALSPTALGFLLGERALGDAFRAERIEAPDRSELGLRLLPRADAGFEALEMWLDPERLVLRESVLQDLFGNRTRVRFDDVQENRGLPDSSFELEVPEGVEVIDLR
jgi:outer membrane lipoprotein carrier protein